MTMSHGKNWTDSEDDTPRIVFAEEDVQHIPEYECVVIVFDNANGGIDEIYGPFSSRPYAEQWCKEQDHHPFWVLIHEVLPGGFISENPGLDQLGGKC